MYLLCSSNLCSKKFIKNIMENFIFFHGYLLRHQAAQHKYPHGHFDTLPSCIFVDFPPFMFSSPPPHYLYYQPSRHTSRIFSDQGGEGEGERLECGRSVSQVYNQPASLALRSVYACNYRLKYL